MRRKIHVLSLVGDLLFGGGQNRLLALARTIDRERFVHTVVTVNKTENQGSAYYRTMHHEYAEAGIEIIDLGKAYAEAALSSLSPKQMIRAGRVLIQVTRRLLNIVR